ncbi:MAG TPA: hypothetical protein VK550_05565 [Polyangiaceae bacterium]|nr:hypothetical protein [Polyangiaceae bacterium]
MLIASVVFATSACFDGGEYGGGGRHVEGPGMIDAAEDALADGSTTDDALPEDVDAPGAEDGWLVDGAFDARSESPPSVEDAGRSETEAAPLDAAVDATPIDVSADGPPTWPDAIDPRDVAADNAVRDAVPERRD